MIVWPNIHNPNNPKCVRPICSLAQKFRMSLKKDFIHRPQSVFSWILDFSKYGTISSLFRETSYKNISFPFMQSRSFDKSSWWPFEHKQLEYVNQSNEDKRISLVTVLCGFQLRMHAALLIDVFVIILSPIQSKVIFSMTFG